MCFICACMYVCSNPAAMDIYILEQTHAVYNAAVIAILLATCFLTLYVNPYFPF